VTTAARRRAPARSRDASETRRRLVEAAAAELNAHGFHGTDTNRIARAAGYAPAMFYRHFDDKRAVFLAVYDEWVRSEWSTIETLAGDGPRALAEAVVAHHERWRIFRASLRALVALDPVVRRHHRRARTKQLETLVALRGGPPRPVDDALALLAIERYADAIADGEAAALGVDREAAVARIAAVIADIASPTRRSGEA
jgi:AcrR family transcriptional regulator